MHDVIPISLDEAVDLKMGDVLMYERTPSKWKPWRKHRLVYSGVNINDVLTSSAKINTEEVVLYDDATFSRGVNDSVGLDADVKTALVAFGVNFDIGEQKTLKAEFGQVKRIVWNLRDEVFKGTFKGMLNMDHPIVKDAKRHGGVLFVVSHLYQSAKVQVTVQETLTAGISGNEKDDKDDNGDDSTPTQGGDTNPITASGDTPPAAPSSDESGKGDDKGSISTNAGITRSDPTYLGFRLLAFKFDAKGTLSMMLRTDLTHAKVKSLDEVDFGGNASIAVLHNDISCPHTLGTGDVAAYCSKQEEEET